MFPACLWAGPPLSRLSRGQPTADTRTSPWAQWLRSPGSNTSPCQGWLSLPEARRDGHSCVGLALLPPRGAGREEGAEGGNGDGSRQHHLTQPRSLPGSVCRAFVVYPKGKRAPGSAHEADAGSLQSGAPWLLMPRATPAGQEAQRAWCRGGRAAWGPAMVRR